MPSVLIEVMKEYSQNQVNQILKSVREGIESAFSITSEHTYLRLMKHDPKNCSLPSLDADAHHRIDDFIHITIDCYPGRSSDKKQQLYQRVLELLNPLGVNEHHIMIIIRENSPENWKIPKLS